MNIEKRLYSHEEVAALINSVCSEIVTRLEVVADGDVVGKDRVLRDIAEELLPQVEQAVALEVAKRHVQGITLSVWAGPPGSGKGTNIDTVSILGSAYAEVVSQGGAARFEEPLHSKLLQFSIAQTTILTGTKGMFNRPEGEYADLFGKLVPAFGKLVAEGGFAPDDAVSVLVELMLLNRLVRNFHRIQIDLWPRTGPQFEKFGRLLEVIRAEGGKVASEVVIIKVIKDESLELVIANPGSIADISVQVAGRISEETARDWYRDELEHCLAITDQRKRYAAESESLERLFGMLGTAFQSPEGRVVVEELRAVCKRLAFRFMTFLDTGTEVRPDEYPLSIIRRLVVYTGDTAPAFLRAVESFGKDGGFYIVSSAGTPEEVIGDILDTLVGVKVSDVRWANMKSLAGEVAVDVVNRKPPVVSSLLERVGGILSA